MKSNIFTGVALLVAALGFTYPLFAQSPARLAQVAVSMTASADATLSANIPENPYNSLAQQLTVKQLSLQEREAELAAKEARNNVPSLGEMFGFASFVLSILLCVLVGLNFYLDSRRSRKGLGLANGRFQVDLR